MVWEEKFFKVREFQVESGKSLTAVREKYNFTIFFLAYSVMLNGWGGWLREEVGSHYQN